VVELTTGPEVVVPGTTGPTPPLGSAVVVIAYGSLVVVEPAAAEVETGALVLMSGAYGF